MTFPAHLLDEWLHRHGGELVAVRRDLHEHPEIAFEEYRTTDVIVERLTAAGLEPRVLPSGTGVLCDIGTSGPIVALRADIDALPLADHKDVPYRSQVEGACHACGHDAHMAILLAAGAVLAEMSAVKPGLPGRVRLMFQPAEEQIPGGASAVIAGGGMDDVEQVYALHCDPRVDTGLVGLRVGPITAASDTVEVHLSGTGGHTGRPHLTADLVYALGRLITDLPGLLARRADPRSAMSLVWGAVEAGHAPNAIPQFGAVRGTLRMLDRDAWEGAESLVRTLVEEIVAPTGAKAETAYLRGVPPVVNVAECVDVQRAAVSAALGDDAIIDTMQSMGGEDFAWYLDHAPGAFARLGVRRPGALASLDLHQSTFDIDEAALEVGLRFTVQTALEALARLR